MGNEVTISLSEFDSAEKERLSSFVEDEELGPMGATRVERWKLSDNRIVRAEWSMGGADFYVEEQCNGQ